VKGSLYLTAEDICREIGADWTWLLDGITGEAETPRTLLDKAKKSAAFRHQSAKKNAIFSDSR